MPRAPRNLYPGVTAHVTNRGAAGEDIFRADGDRQCFLWMVESEVVRRGWRCHAYCLMNNHFHLLIQSPAGDLSAGMQSITGSYGAIFNRVYGRAGHLFQGRFGAVVVERQEHMLELARYIAHNPVRAGFVAHPRDWPWSSYAAALNGSWVPDGLRSTWFVDVLGGPAQLRRFVEGEM